MDGDLHLSQSARIEKLDELGREYGFAIYSVHQCNAGWGVQWYEGTDRERAAEDWRRHLHVYGYYPTIAEMVKAETERVKVRIEALGKA
jgi:hypothetical protein